MLVCADGATSGLATKLGYCTEPPRGVCSRAFVEGGTHNTNFDGVCFYPKWSLPGWVAVWGEWRVTGGTQRARSRGRPAIGLCPGVEGRPFYLGAGACRPQAAGRPTLSGFCPLSAPDLLPPPRRPPPPSYAAIFRHPNDELNFCYYLIPCGKEGYCGDVKE